MSATEACRNCRFSRSKVGRGTPYLFCRRYPPTQLAEGESFFPLVERDEWCGEWMGMRPGAGLPAEIAPAPKRSTEVASGRAA